MSLTPSELLAMDTLERKFAVICALEYERWVNPYMD